MEACGQSHEAVVLPNVTLASPGLSPGVRAEAWLESSPFSLCCQARLDKRSPALASAHGSQPRGLWFCRRGLCVPLGKSPIAR